jgi:hypothetical protein
MRSAIALVFPFALGALAAPAGAQELGRLFHTPEQRHALDARRAARPPQVILDAPPPLQPARVDGYVLRSDGRSTVWVNSGAASAASTPEGMRTDVRRDAPGRVSVSVGGGAQRHEVKVGGTLDAGSGNPRDLIGEGEIKVRR